MSFLSAAQRKEFEELLFKTLCTKVDSFFQKNDSNEDGYITSEDAN